MRHHLSTVLLAAWDARWTRKRPRGGLFSHCERAHASIRLCAVYKNIKSTLDEWAQNTQCPARVHIKRTPWEATGDQRCPPLPLNELNLPVMSSACHRHRQNSSWLQNSSWFVLAWIVKMKRRARARLSVTGRRGDASCPKHDASPHRVQRQPKPLDGFLALWLRRNCDEQQQRGENLEVCHP